MSIYVSCNDTTPVGGELIAQRARSMVGNKRNYSLLLDNCHQFTSGCLTGDFDNADNFLWFLKQTATRKINSNTWRVWKTPNGWYGDK